MMKTLGKTFAKLTIFAILFCLFSLPCFAELRRVPAAPIVEQGLTAITVDAEGAENFRYVGQKDKMHTYVGKIKPESKLKLVIRGSLKNQKELPITGRTSLVRMQVTARKGDTVIKTQNFRKENITNVFLNYTVPKDADTLEVIESFVLTNKSGDSKFNQKVTTLNKLILSTREDVLAAVAGNQDKNNGTDKKENIGTGDKKGEGSGKNTPINADKNTDSSSKKTDGADKNTGKNPEKISEAEANKRFTRIVSGAAFLVLLAGVGIHFFLKNKKSNQIASDRLARKEQLRLQAIERQKQRQQYGAQENETQNYETDESKMKHSEPEEMKIEGQQADSSFDDSLPQDNPEQNIPPADGLNAAAAAGTVQAHFCQNCGAPLKPGSKFCESCGSKI